MSGEKMAILKMLEEGKITAENAANLLAALGEPEEASRTADTGGGRSYGSQAPPRRERAAGSTSTSTSWSSDLGRKIEVAAKDLEPKIHKFVEVVTEKAVELADAATKSISNARERNAARERRPEPPPRGANTGAAEASGVHSASSKGSANTSGIKEKTFELAVEKDLPNELILKTVKGSVSLKGYNGDKVTLNVSYKTRQPAPALEFFQLGCVYQFNCDTDAYEITAAEAFVPFERFKRMAVETSGGGVSVDGVNTDNILINTAGSQVSVRNSEAGELRIDNLDGAVLLSNSGGGSLLVENANGAIDAVNTDFSTLKLETTGEPISVVSQGFYRHNDYFWKISTSNARLKAALPVSLDTAYDIKAFTSLSDVSNGLSGINYTRNDRNCVEGRSDNYDSCAKKVRIELDTSNAPLYIN